MAIDRIDTDDQVPTGSAALDMPPGLVLEAMSWARTRRRKFGDWPNWDELGVGMGWDADQQHGYMHALRRKQLVLLDATNYRAVLTFRAFAILKKHQQSAAVFSTIASSGVRRADTTRKDHHHEYPH